MALTPAEKQKEYRERQTKKGLLDKMYELGYAKQPFTAYGHNPEEPLVEERAAWCKGLWQRAADSKLYDFPKPVGFTAPDWKAPVAAKGRKGRYKP